MATPIKLNDLTPGDSAEVRGKISWSRLAKHYSAEEAQKRTSASRFPITVPFTEVTISDVQIIGKDGKPVTNLSKATDIEKFLASKFYDAKAGRSYNHRDKSPQLPVVIHNTEADGKVVGKQILLEEELSAGSDVSLLVSVFDSKKGNYGLGLDAVIVHDDQVRYYTHNTLNARLAERGIIFEPLPPTEVKDEE